MNVHVLELTKPVLNIQRGFVWINIWMAWESFWVGGDLYVLVVSQFDEWDIAALAERTGWFIDEFLVIFIVIFIFICILFAPVFIGISCRSTPPRSR
jgi:hypothetical protein